MKHLGETSYNLGIKFIRDHKNRMLVLSQANYVDAVLDFKKGYLPFRHEITLSKDQCPKTPEEIDCMKMVPYALVVVSLM